MTATRCDEGPSGSITKKKKKLTSPVWEDFIVSFSTNADGSEDRWGTCKQCGRKIQATSKTHGTNALIKHRDFCNRRYAEVMAYQSASSAASQETTVPARTRQVSTFDPTRTREAVAQLIVGAELPISFGENPFFK